MSSRLSVGNLRYDTDTETLSRRVARVDVERDHDGGRVAHGQRGRRRLGFPRRVYFRNASFMRSLMASMTRTRARCLSLASITCHGANEVLVRSIMSPPATM